MILMTDDIGDVMLCQQHSGGFKTRKRHYTAPSSPPVRDNYLIVVSRALPNLSWNLS